MNLSNAEQEQLRAWSTDENAYQKLLDFLENKSSTEILEAEVALRKSEAMLKKAQEIAGIGSWEVDLDTGKTIWSDEFFIICGLEPQSVEPHSELRLSLIHPDDRLLATEALQKAQEEAQPYQIEKRIVRPDGNICWVESRGEVLFDEITQSRKLVGTFVDITQRKLFEIALIQSEQRALALIDAYPDIIFTFSRDGKFLDYHGNKDELLAQADELLGSTITTNFGKEVGAYILNHIHKTLDTGEMQTFEYQLQLENRLHDFEARTIVSGDDEVIAVVRDMTEAKQAERALQRSEERYGSILSAMMEGVVLVDETGKIVMCNDAAADILGVTPQELMGRPEDPPHLHPINQEGKPLEYEQYPPNVTLRTGQAQSNILMGIHHHQTGELRWTKINTQPLQETEHSKPYGVVMTFDDVTEERQARESQIRAVIESERTKVLSQFIQTASHEFRTPLSVIATNLHILSHLQDHDKRQSKIERIHKHVFHLNNLIEMQLLMTKLDSGIAMQTYAYTVEQLVTDTLVKLDTKVAQKGLILQQDIIPEKLSLIVDAEYFKHALYQILDNAICFSHNSAAIYIHAHKTNTHIIIRIEDEGIGMADEDINYVFERFWRKDKSHTAAGFGLGLSLAAKIVELHNGEIEVESQLNQGTVFTIAIPI